jgi:hypothetical protein
MLKQMLNDIENFQHRLAHTCRYTENIDGSWSFSMFSTANPRRGEGSGGTRGTQPEWLKKIVEVAVVADAFQVVPHPPPGRVLWFELDDHGELSKFTNPE